MTNIADEPTTLEELLERIHDAYADYNAGIAELGPERLLAPRAVGYWNVRDVIGHVGADQQWMAGQLEALLSGVEPTSEVCFGENLSLPAELSTQDGRNAWQYQRLLGLRFRKLRAWPTLPTRVSSRRSHVLAGAAVRVADDRGLAADGSHQGACTGRSRLAALGVDPRRHLLPLRRSGRWHQGYREFVTMVS